MGEYYEPNIMHTDYPLPEEYNEEYNEDLYHNISDSSDGSNQIDVDVLFEMKFMVGSILSCMVGIQSLKLILFCIKECKKTDLNTYLLSEDSLEECSICLELFQKGDNVAKLNCDHLFHKNCINKMIDHNINLQNNFKLECPYCRTLII